MYIFTENFRESACLKWSFKGIGAGLDHPSEYLYSKFVLCIGQLPSDFYT